MTKRTSKLLTNKPPQQYIYKLFTKIITNRITRTLDENQPREQAGFRRGFSTIDHLHAVNQLIEKCAEYKIPLVVGLVDYNKAFDSVEIPDVIKALQEQGVNPVYDNVLNFQIGAGLYAV